MRCVDDAALDCVEGSPDATQAAQLLHGIGFAIDINPSANNWNFGNGRRATTFESIMAHAGELLGQSLIGSARELSAAARGATTEAAFEVISASNEALKRYRLLGRDRQALDAHLASPDCSEQARARGADWWMKTIARDERTLSHRTGKTAENAPPSGFMDYDSATVAALRDVGGLRWGGTDFGGGDSGDMMHFDSYNTDLAHRLRTLVSSARRDAHERH